MKAVVIAFVSGLAFVGCGGKVIEGVGGKEGMLSATTVAKQCEEAAKGHDRPFVVEWDATDLASFEAKAARDTVVVSYRGCELEVLHQCSDAIVAGKLGSYGTPQFTSGTQQQFDIKNEGELYAKLPLGAAKLSGRVSAGEMLSLTYFVTGVAMSSREALYSDELAAIPGCEGATHFVWGYNLGAFSLAVAENRAAEVEAAVGNAGGGARGSQERASLSSGGKLASCEEQDQRGCRVPIRLSLRAIASGQAPAAAAVATSGGGDAPAGGSQQDQAQALWKHGKDLFDKGDGTGCLADLDKAAAADMRLLDRADFQIDRAVCNMAAGDCEGGKKAYRAALAKQDTKREQQDWQLDLDTRKLGNRVCSSSTAKNDPDYIERAYREIQKAAEVGDGKTCEALAKGIAQRAKRLGENTKPDAADLGMQESAQSLSGNGIHNAAVCVAKATKKCKAGLEIYRLQCSSLPKDLQAGCLKVTPDSWDTTHKAMKLDCT